MSDAQRYSLSKSADRKKNGYWRWDADASNSFAKLEFTRNWWGAVTKDAYVRVRSHRST